MKISDLQSFRGAKIGDDDEEEFVEKTETTDEDHSDNEENKKLTIDDYSWNEDVLLSIMEEYGITDRKLFLEHAKNYDEDGNLYLKKSEIINAAKNFNLTTEEELGTSLKKNLLKKHLLKKHLLKKHLLKKHLLKKKKQLMNQQKVMILNHN